MIDRKTDLLIRIKNAYLARHLELKVAYFKLGEMIAKVLLDNGYLGKVTVEIDKKTKKKTLVLILNYQGHKPALENLRLISKPGVRIYENAQKTHLTKLGIGLKIISTSSGVMSGVEAHKKKIGGEIICEVW